MPRKPAFFVLFVLIACGLPGVAWAQDVMLTQVTGDVRVSGKDGARPAVTLLKVFFHDLAALESIYRIAALIGVAILALAASFLYQRFFERTEK